MKNFMITLGFVLGFSLLGRAQEASNVELVHQFVEHFNNHDWEKMAGMYSESAEFKDPAYGLQPVSQTREQTVEPYTGLHKMLPDIKIEIVKLYPSGQHVVMEFVSTGTAPDGSSFQLPICAILTFENGKIVKDYSYYDNF